MTDFFAEVEAALYALRAGGVILYPTDTVWGLGCDATDAPAIGRIQQIKGRDERKGLIVLMTDEREVMQYVAAPDLQVFDYWQEQSRPTTIIFDNAVNLPETLLADDGSVAIRLVKDEFCRHLIKRLRHPLVSTSANLSGQPTPKFFADVSDEVKTAVDHIPLWRRNDTQPAVPSQIIRWRNGSAEVLRG